MCVIKGSQPISLRQIHIHLQMGRHFASSVMLKKSSMILKHIDQGSKLHRGFPPGTESLVTRYPAGTAKISDTFVLINIRAPGL